MSPVRNHLFGLLCLAVWPLLLCPHPLAAQQAFRLLSPSGNALHPAILLVPGCSGFTASTGVNHYEDRATELQGSGYAVVFVDYVGRRMQTNCAHISQAETAADILEAAAWTREQPGIDTHRIFVIGWSYGGGGVLAALKAMPADPPIAKAVMYYPVCRGAGPWSAPVSGLMLLGGKDDVAYPSLCKPVSDGLPADRLRVVTFPDARHGFDNRGLPEYADQAGAPAYNAEAAKVSWADVMAFLK